MNAEQNESDWLVIVNFVEEMAVKHGFIDQSLFDIFCLFDRGLMNMDSGSDTVWKLAILEVAAGVAIERDNPPQWRRASYLIEFGMQWESLRLKASRNKPGPKPKFDVEKAFTMWRKCGNVAEVARSLDVTPQYVRRKFKARRSETNQ